MADKPIDVDRAVGAPIVIAHRGASGERPEHTLAAYELALVEGADFIELDLVLTRDGALIARHENALALVAVDEAGEILRLADGAPKLLEETTDVAWRPEYADRLAVKTVDGRTEAGWFSEDFTLAEIRTLGARERLPDLRPGSGLHDDSEGVPTLEDAIGLVNGYQAHTGRSPGLYIEIKHPTYFRHLGSHLDGTVIGMDPGERLLQALQAAGFTDPERLYIQAFEVAPLMALNDRMAAEGLRIPLIQLFGDVENRRYRAVPRDMAYHAAHGGTGIYGDLAALIPGGITPETSYAELARPEVLAFMARRYAAGIGPPKHNLLVAVPGSDGEAAVSTTPAPLLVAAREAGLLLHPWTLRAEARFLPLHAGRRLTVAEEAALLLERGVDGFFIDQPSEGRLAVHRYVTGVRLFDR